MLNDTKVQPLQSTDSGIVLYFSTEHAMVLLIVEAAPLRNYDDCPQHFLWE